MLNLLTASNEQVASTHLTHLKNLKLSDYDGKNILTLISHFPLTKFLIVLSYFTNNLLLSAGGLLYQPTSTKLLSPPLLLCGQTLPPDKSYAGTAVVKKVTALLPAIALKIRPSLMPIMPSTLLLNVLAMVVMVVGVCST
jgi:hypothetical protein